MAAPKKPGNADSRPLWLQRRRAEGGTRALVASLFASRLQLAANTGPGSRYRVFRSSPFWGVGPWHRGALRKVVQTYGRLASRPRLR